MLTVRAPATRPSLACVTHTVCLPLCSTTTTTTTRVCDLCGRSYNVADINDGDLVMPPLLPQKGDCDECDGEPPLSQRQDDSEAVIRDRLEVYDKMTHPVVEFYRKRGACNLIPLWLQCTHTHTAHY